MALKKTTAPATEKPEGTEVDKNEDTKSTAAEQATEVPSTPVAQTAPADLPTEVVDALETAAAQAAAPLDPAAVAAHEDQKAREQALAKGQDPEKVPTHVKVLNVRKVSQRQPSTGLWIDENEEAYLLNDGWLRNQVRAKLLKVVE